MSERLPKFVADYLRDGAPKGQRNDTLFRAAAQLRDMGMDDSAIYGILHPVASAGGLKSREIATTIGSVNSRPKREAPLGSNGGGGSPGRAWNDTGGRTYRARAGAGAGKPESELMVPDYTLDDDEKLPEGHEDGARVFLRALFLAGEGIQLVRGENDAEGKERPSSRSSFQAILTLEKWLTRLDGYDGDVAKSIYPASEPHGVYVSINPMKGDRRIAENVSAFRHALIEFDDIPKHHQWQLIRRSNIPCIAVTDSGGKSIHAIVRVDARDKDEYQQRVAILVDHFRKWGVDAQNIDPTRLSRLPGATRGDTLGQQRLLALHVGAESFTEWMAGALYDHELPPEQSIDALLSFDRTADPDCMIGKRWLCRGGSMIISGQSGIGKSSLLMQMAMTFGQGKDFFGITPIRPLKALVIQAENDLGDLAEAFQDIRDGMELSDEEIEVLRGNLHFFRDTIHTGEKFVTIAARLIEKHRPDIVFADPLLAFCGDDIGQQSVASAFLRNMLGPVLAASGVVWVFLHHTGKPQKEAKAGWNLKDLAYSGLGSSELANWARETITLARASDTEDVYAISLSKRGRRSGLTDGDGNETSIAYLRHAADKILWERAEGFDPAAEADAASGRGKRGRKRAGGEDGEDGGENSFIGPVAKAGIGESLREPKTAAEAMKIVADTLKTSERTTRRRLKEWVENGWLSNWRDGRGMRYQLAEARLEGIGEAPIKEEGWEALLEPEDDDNANLELPL